MICVYIQVIKPCSSCRNYDSCTSGPKEDNNHKKTKLTTKRCKMTTKRPKQPQMTCCVWVVFLSLKSSSPPELLPKDTRNDCKHCVRWVSFSYVGYQCPGALCLITSHWGVQVSETNVGLCCRRSRLDGSSPFLSRELDQHSGWWGQLRKLHRASFLVLCSPLWWEENVTDLESSHGEGSVKEDTADSCSQWTRTHRYFQVFTNASDSVSTGR